MLNIIQSCHLKAISLQSKQHFSSRSGVLPTQEGRIRDVGGQPGHWTCRHLTWNPRQDKVWSEGMGKSHGSSSNQKFCLLCFFESLESAENLSARSVSTFSHLQAEEPLIHRGSLQPSASPLFPLTEVDHLSTRKDAILFRDSVWIPLFSCHHLCLLLAPHHPVLLSQLTSEIASSSHSPVKGREKS